MLLLMVTVPLRLMLFASSLARLIEHSLLSTLSSRRWQREDVMFGRKIGDGRSGRHRELFKRRRAQQQQQGQFQKASGVITAAPVQQHNNKEVKAAKVTNNRLRSVFGSQGLSFRLPKLTPAHLARR